MSMKIGETIKYKDTILKCVENYNCTGCYFDGKDCKKISWIL